MTTNNEFSVVNNQERHATKCLKIPLHTEINHANNQENYKHDNSCVQWKIWKKLKKVLYQMMLKVLVHCPEKVGWNSASYVLLNHCHLLNQNIQPILHHHFLFFVGQSKKV